MKTKGFTLIELMIVVALIGILASVVIPKFADLITRSKIHSLGYEPKKVMKYFEETYSNIEDRDRKIALFVNEEKGSSIRTEYERYKSFRPSKFKKSTRSKPSSGAITMQRSDLIKGMNCDCTCR